MDHQYSLCQQAFVLSWKSNWLVELAGNNQHTKGELEDMLSAKLDDFFADHQTQGFIGRWRRVWGPAVYIHATQGPRGIADNVTYAAQRGDEPLYVVATAGTNSHSKYAARVEDLEVQITTAWKQAFHDVLGRYDNPSSHPNPCLSSGTTKGVNALLATTPERRTDPGPGRPERLHEFLGKLSSRGATLIVTGHSLGGALAPALALALRNPNGGPLSEKHWPGATVRVLPVAGATPGNADLAGAFQTVFPPIPHAAPADTDVTKVEVWNQDIGNLLDIVPVAWIPGDMDGIPPALDGTGGLYAHLVYTDSSLPAKLRKLFAFGKKRSQEGAKSRPEGSDPGTVAGDYARIHQIQFHCEELDPTATIATLGDYVNHWKKQHTQAYLQQIFKVDEVLPGLPQGPAFGLFAEDAEQE